MDSLPIFVYILFVVLYFAPAVYATLASKKRTAAIFALNLLLGWTVIGWIGALVWAMVEQEDPAKLRAKRPPSTG